MYHYVRPRDPRRWPGVFPLEPEEFEAQLDFLATLGRIADPAELAAPADPSGPHRIFLTFDDGTRDHHDVVLPILARRGLRGLFGLISSPALLGEMPTVHLVHQLSSRLADAAVWDRLVGDFGEAALGDEEAARRLYRFDTPRRARIKFALNFGLAPEAARDFLTRSLEAIGEDPRELAQRWYLGEEEIRRLARAGMAFAVHAHRHLAYQAPPERFCREEIDPCLRWLERLLGERVRWTICAFGGANAAGSEVRALEPSLRRRGQLRAFLTEPGIQPASGSGFFLRRLDAAELPPRKPAAALERLLESEVTPA